MEQQICAHTTCSNTFEPKNGKKYCSYICGKRAYDLKRDAVRPRTTSYKERRKIAKKASKYGISKEEVSNLLKRDKCDSCGDNIEGSNQHIDHCHTTGDVRGVLCRSCNIALGHLKDDYDKIQKLGQYLLKSMSGVSASEYEFDEVLRKLDKQGDIEANMLLLNTNLGGEIDDILAPQRKYGENDGISP